MLQVWKSFWGGRCFKTFYSSKKEGLGMFEQFMTTEIMETQNNSWNGWILDQIINILMGQGLQGKPHTVVRLFFGALGSLTLL